MTPFILFLQIFQIDHLYNNGISALEILIFYHIFHTFKFSPIVTYTQSSIRPGYNFIYVLYFVYII